MTTKIDVRGSMQWSKIVKLLMRCAKEITEVQNYEMSIDGQPQGTVTDVDFGLRFFSIEYTDAEEQKHELKSKLNLAHLDYMDVYLDKQLIKDARLIVSTDSAESIPFFSIRFAYQPIPQGGASAEYLFECTPSFDD